MADPVITCKALSKRAPMPEQGDIRTLDLDIHAGDTVAILGMRRWERKTFIDMISALERPDSGDILFEGKTIIHDREKDLNTLRSRLGIVTNPPTFLNNVRIRENLRLPLRYHSTLNTAAIDEKLDSLLDDMEMEPFSDLIPSNFEPDFKGAAALARALSLSPTLLIVERPRECLGKAAVSKLPGLWNKHVLQHGGAVLMFTTTPGLALALCRKIAVFDNGCIASIENKKSFLKSKKALETQWKDPDDDGK